MSTRRVVSTKTKKEKLYLFNLPDGVIDSVMESLKLKDIVVMVEYILMSTDKCRKLWIKIKGSLRCPDLNNRRYSEDAFLWVLKREIKIRNFTTHQSDEGLTELHDACIIANPTLARACIAFNDQDINAPDNLGWTPLAIACYHGCYEVAKSLLEANAFLSLYHDTCNPSINPTFNNINRNLPIDIAIDNPSQQAHGNIDMIKLLLKYYSTDKEMALKNLGVAFHMVTLNKNIEVMKLLVDACGSGIANSSDRSSSLSPLHKCCYNSDDAAVLKCLLLELHADVDPVDMRGLTPLALASLRGRPDCVKELLKAGAAVNHLDRKRETPLTIAIKEYEEAAVSCEVGGDYEYETIKEDMRKVVKLLKAAGGLTAAELG